MLEVKDNKLIIDDTVKDLKDINLINGKNNNVYFSDNMLERIKIYPYSVEKVHLALLNAGLNDFWLVNNTIINLNNIERVYIKYYQNAGVSVVESSKANAATCFVNIVCKNGRTESISFSSDKEAEKFYHLIDDKIADMKMYKHMEENNEKFRI